jgi:hypothetical protein
MRIGEPSVKHDVLGSEPCFQGLIEQLDNYIGPLLSGHNPPLGRDCALVDLLGRPDDILIVL